MKKYLFNMEKNAHNIFLALNVAKNNENWDRAREINEIYTALIENQINYRFSEVSYDIWRKAKEISDGAIHYRAQCNAGY